MSDRDWTGTVFWNEGRKMEVVAPVGGRHQAYYSQYVDSDDFNLYIVFEEFFLKQLRDKGFHGFDEPVRSGKIEV
jgi:hypothetical protein